MKKVYPVTGGNLLEFAQNYNHAVEELNGCKIVLEDRVDGLNLLIYYEEPDGGEDLPTDELIERIRQDAEEMFQADLSVDDSDPEESEPTTIIVKLTIGAPRDRFCCECKNYSWGRGCSYKKEHVEHMHAACELFNVMFGRCRK